LIVKPYGDTLDDGAVQLSFTLPLKESEKTKEAAGQLIKLWGFDDFEIVHSVPLSEEFTFFVVYAKTSKGIDMDKIEIPEYFKEKSEPMGFDEINAYIKKNIKRKIIIVGACTGFDAHTVGIDAIFNMKGYDHHFGLERYPMIRAYNLGAQMPNEKVIDASIETNADAILISQVVTQKNIHIKNLTEFIKIIKARNLRERFILIAGGPRMDNKTAHELGFDAGFGKGTYAEHVAEFIIMQIEKKQTGKEK